MMQATEKLLDIEQNRRKKKLKKEIEKRKMRKSQTATIHIFLVLLFYKEEFC